MAETAITETAVLDTKSYRKELSKAKGAENFLGTLEGVLKQYESVAGTGLQGYSTYSVAANAVLQHGLHDDEEYAVAVRLQNQAGEAVDDMNKKFEMVTGWFFKFHRALTGLRSAAQKPWADYREKLDRITRAYYLAQQEAKRKAEAEIARSAQRQQAELEKEAEELISSGYVREGREKLAQAGVMDNPVILPDAVPKVEGARVTDRYIGTCYDTLAALAAVVKGEFPLMHEVKVRGGGTEMRPLFVVDQTVLNAIVDRAGMTLKVPGIKVEPDVRIGRK